MGKRVLLIAALTAFVWGIAAGAIAGANEVILSLTNRTGKEVKVEIFNDNDPIKWVPCEIVEMDEFHNLTKHVKDDGGWLASCGNYGSYFLRAKYYGYDETWRVFTWITFKEYSNVQRGSHVIISN